MDELIEHLKTEILKNGYVRNKLAVILNKWFKINRKIRRILNCFDQLLFENKIIVYTKRDNVKNEKENWNWFDLKNNDCYITFIFDENVEEKIRRDNLIKMRTINEPIPTVGLLDRYLNESKEVLICSAYLDEEMAKHIVDICMSNKIGLRIISDINFNSNPYNRSRIRSLYETVGTFRTLSGLDNESGIMHLKLYVFYHKNNEITVFNTSANCTAAAWKFVNLESPITIQTGNRNDTQLDVLINAAENLWSKSQMSQVMKFNINDKVNHPDFGIGQILIINEPIAGVLFGGSKFENVKISDLTLMLDPIQKLKDKQFTEKDNIHRVKSKFLAHYIDSQNSLTNEFDDVRIKPVPHQLLALKKAITSPAGGNLLFADDVGLGKTIEAGLVIQHKIRRIGDKARILIMCPAGLKMQWYEEMKDKFGLNFNGWRLHTQAGAEAFSGSFHGQNRLIASYHGMIAGETEKAILKAIDTYDLVVIDECHKFSNDSTQWWQLTRDLREKGKITQLLLLSATPHSGDKHRFLNLMNLLDNKIFPKGHQLSDSLNRVADRGIIENYIYRNDKLSVSDFDGKPLFRNIMSETVDVELSEEEKAFCDLVVKYIIELDRAKQKASIDQRTQIGFVVSVYRKMLASSWRNVFRSLLARYRYLLNEELEEEGIEALPVENEEEIDEREERKIQKLIKDMKSKKIFSMELEYLRTIYDAGSKLITSGIDTKIQKLFSIVNKPENEKEKFIIFTQYVKTLEIIKQALGVENCKEIQGSTSMQQRIDNIEKFKNQDKFRFLVSTEAGGEGINLQFAYNVINYDMPWNPARLQQRIGRVWRYGQENDVKCYNFFVTNSISDQRVLERLNERITEMVHNFLVPLEYNGVHENLREALVYDVTMRVLGYAQEEESFESIMGILDEELRKQRIAQAEERIKEALNFVQQDQRELAPTVGIKLDEIDNFYSPRDINFLELFGNSIAKSFKGKIIKHHSGYSEFVGMDLSGTGLPNTLFLNKKYTFEHGKAGKYDNEIIYYFGFGDEFFNQMIEQCKNQSFGGFVSNAVIENPAFEKKKAIALVSAIATSPAGDNQNSETYSICSFVSLPDIVEISPAHLFNSDWSEHDKTNSDFEPDKLHSNLQQIVINQQDKLKAFRHREFVTNSPTVEAIFSINGKTE